MKTCLCVSGCTQVRYFTESIHPRRTGAKETPDQITMSEATFPGQDRIEITGKPIHGRNLVIVNGSPLGITNRSLEILLHLAVALKHDGGWVHKIDLARDLEAPQLISRLRSEIRNHTPTNDGRIIENDGSGSYRLSVPPLAQIWV
ncbi:MAG: hypothetical protein JRF30_01045 [Deltaproteobacteria bacterium]|nr:hypothetical protein [Deltaproteobacteria bacterium]MBW1793791.1 hypothetical protein [Deltaproteobacteria bacterium]MBW2329538.1 hypothetical protein [Deltaproteobacteria bacterium]